LAVPGAREPGKDKAPSAIREVEKGIASVTSHEEAFVFKPNGRQVFHKIGGESSVEFTLEELDSMRNNVLTHNHPTGRSFSRSDVELAVEHRLREIRAVTSEWVYRLEVPDSVRRLNMRRHEEFRSRLHERISEISQEVNRQLDNDIRAGRLNRTQAKQLREHLVWTKVSEEFRIPYERIAR